MNQRHPAILPVCTFLVAVSLCCISGGTPRLLAHRRMMADPTSGCLVTKITILPLETKATIPDAVSGYKYKKANTPADTAYTSQNVEAVPAAVVEMLFDANPNRGGGHRIWTGRTTKEDKSHHDVILAKVEGGGPPNSTVRIVVESMDVDDPSDQDPPAADYAVAANSIKVATAAFVAQNRRDPEGPELIQITLTGGHTGDSHVPLSPGLPVVDWENYCFDNRGNPLGGRMMPFKDLKQVDQQSLATNYSLGEANFKNVIIIDPNTRKPWVCKHTEPSVICSHAEADVLVDANGMWTQYFLCQVSMQPGDNYRLLACCKEHEGDLHKSIPVQSQPGGGTGDVVIKISERATPPPGREIGHCRHEDITYEPLPPTVVKSELVTVWRRTYVEADMMGGTPWAADRVDPTDTVPPPVNTDHAYRPAIVPDLGLMSTYFNDAYVDPVPDLQVKYAQKPVLTFQPSLVATDPTNVYKELQPVRECPRQADYWSVHLVGVFESSKADSDPQVPAAAPLSLANIAAGRSGGHGSTGGTQLPPKIVTSMAYHETIRHVSDLNVNTVFGEPGRQTGPFKPGALNTMIQRCYVHEAIHQFTDAINHGDGGTMWPHVVWCGAQADFVPTDPFWTAGTIPRRERALIRSVGSP